MPSGVKTFTRIISVTKVLLPYVLIGSFVLMSVLSFSYGVKGDANFLHYMAYLMDVEGMVPYKDIYTVNLPGTYWFHIGIGKIFGYSSNSLSVANTLCLSVLWFVSYRIMKPFGKAAATTAGTLFGLLYLGGGPFAGLQRDFFAVLLIAVSLLIIQNRSGLFRDRLSYFLIGCLFGWVLLIKPHLIVGLPVVLIYGCLLVRNGFAIEKELIRDILKNGSIALIGVILMLMISFFWLWSQGAWSGFAEVFRNYLPLYAQLSDDWVIRDGVNKWLFKFKSLWQIKGYVFLVFGAVVGAYFCSRNSIQPAFRKKAICLLILSFVYFVAIIFAGRVWFNYLMPFLYFLCLCAAMLLSKLPQLSSRWQVAVIALFLFSLISVFRTPYSLFRYQYANGGFSPPEYIFHTDFESKKQEFLTYLNGNLGPDQIVQPISFLGGTTEALFEVKARIATPYVFSLPFYHHISEPYIRDLRKDFILKLKMNMPEIIVEVPTPMMSRSYTSTDFPDLKQFLDRNYRLDYQGESGFVVWRPLNSTGE